jgi:steroid 5-alpha reductase family enzyme
MIRGERIATNGQEARMIEYDAYLWGAAASAIGFAALWPISLWRRDASVVDLWWGPGFFAFVVAAMSARGAVPGGGEIGTQGLVALGLLALWSARMGWTLIARRVRASGEDPRYSALRASRGKGWWWKSLFVIFALQTLLQGLLVAPTAATILADPTPAGALLLLGAAIALGGLALETIADAQLDAWAAARPEQLCTTGLRALARHPNYTGEIMFWSGMALIGIDAGILWAPTTPILLALLLALVSGKPMMEERLERHAAWTDYAAATPPFVPSLRALGAALRRRAGV